MNRVTKILVAFALVVACATAVVSQTLPLTLTNLKGPIARALGTDPAKSIAELWKQITRLADRGPPVTLPTPVPTKTPSPAPTSSPTPNPSPTAKSYFTDAERAAYIGQDYDFGGGNHIPGTAAPDDLGAFRFICTAGQRNYDDPVVYFGIKNGSPHGHRWYGNSLGDYRSEHANLIAAGDSTCSNPLNRSAYWVPMLMTEDGLNEIVMDWVNIYYKRLPKTDPKCFRIAEKGCIGIPRGLRVISGFDMKRMGEDQPENRTYSHRCITEGRPSIHRALINEAIADCGGFPAQVVSAISFGECWNGQLDSPDHRSHLTGRIWNNGEGHNAPWPGACPKTHPYLIPQLSQLVAYTIEKSDGQVWFSSDRMAGMAPMPGGSTFHADYTEGWDEKTRLTWEGNCLDKLLSCSDGSLGDGTRLIRPVLTYKANPRLVPALKRPTS